MAKGDPLVQVEDLVIRFPISQKARKQTFIRPVDHVSFEIGHSEVLALVGESGSGKSTIGRALIRITEPSHGKIIVRGQDVSHIKGRALREYRRFIQMIFQDPFGSLNPIRTIEQHIEFPLKTTPSRNNDSVDERMDYLLTRVGLTPVADIRAKFPHELSGGQRQRVAIARALAVNPGFLVADEPISMLDVSIRAGILKLMNELKDEFGLSYLYITHDLASARYFGDRIMVIYGGKVMETAPSSELIRNPQHPYTKLLLAATPGSPVRGPLPETSNSAPNLFEGRMGCPFADRCPHVLEKCTKIEPEKSTISDEHTVFCHLMNE